MRKSILDALFSKTRQAVLSACLLHPNRWWYLSDLAKHLNVSPSSLQRELASLVEGGLLDTRRDGNRVYYRTNPECPGVQDLQALLVKTAGVADIVKEAMKNLWKEIDLSFIYGSIARAEGLSSSDIDLMIVGKIKLGDVSASIKKAERILEREINPTIYSREEFKGKVKDGEDAFIKTILKDKKIFLKGNESELKALAK